LCCCDGRGQATELAAKLGGESWFSQYSDSLDQSIGDVLRGLRLVIGSGEQSDADLAAQYIVDFSR